MATPLPVALPLDRYLVDVLLPDLVGHDKRPAAFLLFLWLWANTRAVGRRSGFFSYQMLADRTGLSKRALQRSVTWLERRELLKVARKSKTAVPEYAPLAPWQR
jgi:hypothetical protein